MVTPFFVGYMLVAVAIVGLIHDGGMATRARSEAFGLASAAARAGSQQLSEDARAEGTVELDTTAAAAAAQSYLAAHDVIGQVDVTPDQITVTVDQTVDYVFLPGGRTVSSTATVEPTQGP